MINKLEKGWKQEPWQKWTEKQWLEAFPEAKEIIPQKTKEWEEIALSAICDCIQRRREIESETKDDFSKFFWLELAKWNEGKRLLDACVQLDRLSSLRQDTKSQDNNYNRFVEAVERAKTADIIELAYKYLPKLSRSGKNYCVCCIFHEEGTPSLFLYPETSSYHCFGCQAHGDAINLLMKLENIDFKDAVRKLGGL